MLAVSPRTPFVPPAVLAEEGRLPFEHAPVNVDEHSWPTRFEDDVSQASDNEVSYELNLDAIDNGRLRWHRHPWIIHRRAQTMIRILDIPGPVPHGLARDAGLERSWAAYIAARESCVVATRQHALSKYQYDQLCKYRNELELLPRWNNRGRHLPQCCVDLVMGFLLDNVCYARLQWLIDGGSRIQAARNAYGERERIAIWRSLMRWRIRYDRWRFRDEARNIRNASRTLVRLKKKDFGQLLVHCPSILTKDPSAIDVDWHNRQVDLGSRCYSTCTGTLSFAQR